MEKKLNQNDSVTRRDFIKTSAAMGMATLLSGRAAVFAQPSNKLRVALIGCGGRGKGALKDCMDAGKHIGVELEVVATADWFKDRAEEAGKLYNLSESRCFSGADGYKKLLETNADVVLMATSPNFRPLHFETAIKEGKHVFMEKPVAVDPPGVRRLIEAGELAKKKGLSVVAGTQRRHQTVYRRAQYAVEHGAIGKIRGGYVWWCGTIPWIHYRKSGQSDADYMVDNWVNFVEMSGDHIVEQHIHNIDIANWFIGHPPIRALGLGGRAQRKTGNQFDFFGVQYDYAEDLHIQSMCRQMSGCYNRATEHFVGSEGSTFGDGSKMESHKSIDIPAFSGHDNPYVQEHIDLLSSILGEKPINEAREVGESTLTAIMGRISAYTGQIVRWSDLTEDKNSQWYNLTLKPTAEDFEKDDVVAPPDDIVPIPGAERQRR
jgi:myo-inositol 2-dehydrogenase/D-chiro-inositol 1-dehydrogenase